MDVAGTNTIAIVSLSAEDRTEAVDIWFESFYDYPAMRQWFIGHAKNEQQYSEWLRVFFGRLFDTPLYLNYPLLGLRDDMGQLVAAMGCVDVVEEQDWPEALQGSYDLFAKELGVEGIRKVEYYEEITTQHCPKTPHFFVDVLGVRKNHQGKGYARKLLDEIQAISATDPKSSGVFLDTELVENVSFYQHLGYQLTGESDVEGLHVWHLFRPDSH